MKTPLDPHDDWILLTGATGFLGPAIVHELLARKHRVLCLVRAATPSEARCRFVQAQQVWTDDVERLLESGRLAVLRGDIHADHCGCANALRQSLRGRVKSLVHAAGSTRFTASSDGEPHRTNITGTQNVVTLARDLQCRDWHLISTAYVAGAVEEAYETISTSPPKSRNAYEQSKWEGEQLARRAAAGSNAQLTIYRPSIIVGHSQTGRTARFTGIYYLFRATSMLAKAAAADPKADRHNIPLRINAIANRRPNLICIDDVAREFADIFETPSAHGGIYHLTHPSPPSNALIRDAIETSYNIAGGRFVDEPLHPTNADDQNDNWINPFQQLFDEMTTPVHDYLFDAPRFDRSCVDRFTHQPPAEWTAEHLRRLITTAELGGWRPSGYERQASEGPEAIATYFEDYLPKMMAVSESGQARNVDLAVRFQIGNGHDASWCCRFKGGHVESVVHASDQHADVIYKTSESRFWAAVAGDITGAELFLSGEARIEGNIEQALKFAMVLEAFVRAHPYRRGQTQEPEPANDCIEAT